MSVPFNVSTIRASIIAEFAEYHSPERVLPDLAEWAAAQEREGEAEGHVAWEMRHGRIADICSRCADEIAALEK